MAENSKILTSDDDPLKVVGKTITGDDFGSEDLSSISSKENLKKDEVKQRKERLANATLEGIWEILPEIYSQGTDWVTIKSGEPFETLYLDWRFVEKITPPIVQNRAELIGEFWNNKFSLLAGGARNQLERLFGKGTIEQAVKDVQISKEKLETLQQIQAQAKEQKNNFYKSAFSQLEEKLSPLLLDNLFTKEEFIYIKNCGEAIGLQISEVSDFLREKFEKEDFHPLSKSKDGNPFSVKWAKKGFEPKENTLKTVLLEEEVSSREEVAEVLFRKYNETERIFSKAEYLSTTLNKVEGIDLAFNIEDIFAQIRTNDDLLKYAVIYTLDSSLPYRLSGKKSLGQFDTLESLILKGADNDPVYRKMQVDYENLLLPIWLKSKEQTKWTSLPGAVKQNEFLTFLYSHKKDFPFYLISEKIKNAESLATLLSANRGAWIEIAGHISDGAIRTWFQGSGNNTIWKKYEDRYSAYLNLCESKNLNISVNIQSHLAVQFLSDAIVDGSQPIELSLSRSEIRHLGVESPVQITEEIIITANRPGAVLVNVRIEGNFPEGSILLSETNFELFDIGSQAKKTIQIIYKPELLQRKTNYKAAICLDTLETQTKLETEVELAFPKLLYALELGKYAAAGGVFMFLVRWLLGVFTGYTDAFWNYDEFAFGYQRGFMPNNYFIFFLMFLVMISGWVFLWKQASLKKRSIL